MKQILSVCLLCADALIASAQESPIILEIESGGKGVILARTTTGSIQNPIDGLLLYDTIEHAFKYYDGTMWKTLNVIEQHRFYYLDLDGDTYGDSLKVVYAPEPPNDAYVANDLDCNDSDAGVNPGIEEICDNIDNNCDGQIDEGNVCIECNHEQVEQMPCGTNMGACVQGIMTRVCQNGIWGPWSECVGEVGPSPEICDGKDNDCNGQIDDNPTDCQAGFICINENCVQIP